MSLSNTFIAKFLTLKDTEESISLHAGEWALTLLIIFFIISIPFTILYLIIGKAAWSEMVGTLAAGIVRF